MPSGGPRDENDLPGSVAILAATMNFSPETCPYRPRVRAGMPALPGIFRGVSMPGCGATTDENDSPLGRSCEEIDFDAGLSRLTRGTERQRLTVPRP